MTAEDTVGCRQSDKCKKNVWPTKFAIVGLLLHVRIFLKCSIVHMANEWITNELESSGESQILLLPANTLTSEPELPALSIYQTQSSFITSTKTTEIRESYLVPATLKSDFESRTSSPTTDISYISSVVPSSLSPHDNSFLQSASKLDNPSEDEAFAKEYIESSQPTQAPSTSLHVTEESVSSGTKVSYPPELELSLSDLSSQSHPVFIGHSSSTLGSMVFGSSTEVLKVSKPLDINDDDFQTGVQNIAVELDKIDFISTETINEFDNKSGYTSLPEIQTIRTTLVPPLKYITTSSRTIAPVGKELVVFFRLRVTNMVFSDNLFNKSSPEYKMLEQRFKELLLPYLQSNLTGFKQLEILNFREGSVIVNSKMKFIKSVPYNISQAVYCVLEDFCNAAAKRLNLEIDSYSLDVEPADEADACKFMACNKFSKCVINRVIQDAACICQPGYISRDGLPCQSICEVQPGFCQNGEKCEVVPGRGAVCRVTHNLCISTDSAVRVNPVFESDDPSSPSQPSMPSSSNAVAISSELTGQETLNKLDNTHLSMEVRGTHWSSYVEFYQNLHSKANFECGEGSPYAFLNVLAQMYEFGYYQNQEFIEVHLVFFHQRLLVTMLEASTVPAPDIVIASDVRL
nr:PREDICTED: interphotoreceptor matrix proteoglycan 1 [Latimeria chalumnae]|eukprot:XP_014347756.1 PREDICTED: interphotoreceptor matrix proteoglycan 1 [Latimeria chalumnae]